MSYKAIHPHELTAQNLFRMMFSAFIDFESRINILPHTSGCKRYELRFILFLSKV